MPFLQLNSLAGFCTFDPTSFDDPNSPSSYSWKVEDILAGRSATINRAIVSYTDLGKASFTAFLSGTDDQQQAVTSDVVTQAIGTIAAPGIIKTVILGINLTGQNLQFTINRAKAAGPVSITKVRLEGQVEVTTY